jgi:hypothetical protein
MPHRTSPEQLEAKLREAGLGRASLARIAPSLEDVFIALVQKAGSGNGHGRAS